MILKLVSALNFFKLSRKYTFALIGIISSMGVLYLVQALGFSDSLAKCAIISCELVILVITTTFLTGQAKIDIQAVYGTSKQAFEIPGSAKAFMDLMKSKPVAPPENKGPL